MYEKPINSVTKQSVVSSRQSNYSREPMVERVSIMLRYRKSKQINKKTNPCTSILLIRLFKKQSIMVCISTQEQRSWDSKKMHKDMQLLHYQLNNASLLLFMEANPQKKHGTLLLCCINLPIRHMFHNGVKS